QYQYMRPETLFGPKKFESYLQSATRWEQKGRPKRADWGAKKRVDTPKKHIRCPPLIANLFQFVGWFVAQCRQSLAIFV
ncbi:hypothetical protein V5G94_24970, partial [Citrobacter braakii]